MTLADLSFYLFTIFNGLRVVSYLPQIVRVARDRHGAAAISYTPVLWTGANATTGLYAQVNLNDPMLAAINGLNAGCCALVVVLTAYKRHRASLGDDGLATRRNRPPYRRQRVLTSRIGQAREDMAGRLHAKRPVGLCRAASVGLAAAGRRALSPTAPSPTSAEPMNSQE